LPQPRHVSGIGKRVSEHSLDKDAIALGRQTPFTSRRNIIITPELMKADS